MARLQSSICSSVSSDQHHVAVDHRLGSDAVVGDGDAGVREVLRPCPARHDRQQHVARRISKDHLLQDHRLRADLLRPWVTSEWNTRQPRPYFSIVSTLNAST